MSEFPSDPGHFDPDRAAKSLPPFDRPPHVAGSFLDRYRNASFGFLHLASAAEVSPATRYAYGLRIHPEATALGHEFAAAVGALAPNELGQLAALLQCNDIQGIFGQAQVGGSDELGLVVTVQYDKLPDADVPDEEWCDTDGRPIKVVRELTDAYAAVREYEAMTEEAMAAAIDCWLPEDTPEMQAYTQGWGEVAGRLAVHYAELHSTLRSKGPFYGFDFRPVPEA